MVIIISKNSVIDEELKKCDFSEQYTVEIASTVGIRLNDECFVRPLYGDIRGYIKKSGEIVMMEISTEKGHQNVYCDVSVDDLVATPWGHFNDKALEDKNLGKDASLVLENVRKRIKIDDKLNNSFKRPSF